jgi:hypothetical protein
LVIPISFSQIVISGERLGLLPAVQFDRETQEEVAYSWGLGWSG